MSLKLAHFLSIMLYALVAGVLWGTWLSLARTMTEYDAATFLADGKHMIANLATTMPVLMIATAVTTLVVVILLFGRRAMAGWAALAGLLALVAVIVVTLAVEVPIDNQIKTWTIATLPPDWEAIRSRWASFHTLRTFLSLAGLAAIVGAAFMTGPRLSRTS
jgi:Anthrone oxygenase